MGAALQGAQEVVESGKAPWAAVSVWGWADSPIAWLGREHSTSHNMGVAGCESHYVVIIMSNQDLLVMKALGEGEA